MMSFFKDTQKWKYKCKILDDFVFYDIWAKVFKFLAIYFLIQTYVKTLLVRRYISTYILEVIDYNVVWLFNSNNMTQYS